MKVSKLQKILSYLIPVKIWKGSGTHHSVLELFLSNGQWQLSTEDAIYSDGTRYRPLLAAFKKIKLRLPGVKSVLFLGSGIGSGAQILNEMGFYPEIALVDNDVEVLRLAKKLLPPQKLRFECVDANEFIEISTENFDLIVIDLFLGRVTVPYVSTAGFIEKCRQRLLVGGIIVVNFMVNSKEDQKQFEFLSKNLLPASEVIDLGINKVIVTTT